VAWLTALPGKNPLFAAPEVYFPNLPGYGTQTRLRSVGAYLSLHAIRQEYQLGGSLHLGASYQEGWGKNKLLKYYSYEIQMEGRLPIASGRSALVGQANLEFNRRRGGSDPIQFYLLPHIGGSSTLRGFRLDRFYGTNLFLLSLEYRYRLHPNIQAILFFDEGQIFDRTEDLSWLNWHRNYGLGFRYRAGAENSTVVRVEFGHSSEGFQFHISFGDRVLPPLRGPIRYGAYR
jgi:outer membrane protein assembly factor BamA